MGPNSGGGRRNQQDMTGVPRRAMFSNFCKGGGAKGKDDKGKGKGKREPRVNYGSQKEMDRAKGKGKSAPSGAAAHIAAAAARAAGAGGTQQAPASMWERGGATPSYIHGVFCMTRDDHLALEPLLTPYEEGRAALFGWNGQDPAPPKETVDGEVADEAVEHLRELGFQPRQVLPALEIVGPRLVQEAEERETTLSDRAAAERALEWICCTSSDESLPSKLREQREVTNARKAQEDRNVTFQTKALLLGGEIDSLDITRIEKLGFSRARAIQALAESPKHALLPAVRSLLSEFLPLDLPDGAEAAEPASYQELLDEIEALQSSYGEKSVHSIWHGENGLELSVSMPSVGAGGGGGQWQLLAMIVPDLAYPHVSPLLCPKHERLREANRPRLMTALGEVCREALGAPMLFILCEWLQSEGSRFLVRTASDEDVGDKKDAAAAQHRQKDLAVERALEESRAASQKEEDAAREKAKRCDYLLGVNSREASKPKDRIACAIRGNPETEQFDLSGYEDHQAQQLVKEAFGQPLESDAMVRITFVVGGGKVVRGKYSEGLPKAVATALQELGYTQDSTASCDLESAGKFKGQHDTQKNQKLVHVFPRISRPAAQDVGITESTEQARARLARATWDDFVEEVGPWVRSRDGRPQAEALVNFLNETIEDLKETDEALRRGKQISEARRMRYDEFGGPDDVAEKVRWIASALSPKSVAEPNGVRGAGLQDGETLSFDAPSRLQEAARLAGQVAVEKDEDTDDESWLERRVSQTKPESEKLRAEFAAEKPLRAVRESLPAFALREAIQLGVRESQVILVEGETGCGKSTQLPQFLLEDWVARGHGGAANIVMTQPRRISAIGVSERIASEMNTRLGDLVGYSIRLENKRSARTKILCCTTGVLLRRLECDRKLRAVTHVIVDECHERDLDTDFLLIILRDLLPKRPGLRVVLMSATINAQIFKDYFGGCMSFHIPGRTFPVTPYYLEHALQHTGFIVEPGSEYCRKDVDPVMTHAERQELEQAYEKAEYQELLGDGVPSRVIEQLHRIDPERINFELVAAVVRHINNTVDPPQSGKSPGAILVFVPGLGEIKKTIRALSDEAWDGGKGKGKKGQSAEFRGSGGKGANRWSSGRAGNGAGPDTTKEGLWVLPLHSMISVSEQRLVFNRPPNGARKVVVTTNIAETSITIDDVEYVVDCGRHKQTKYDPQNRVSMLVDCVETKANAKQRRGRAGRVKAGVCYHLVNVRKWRRMEDFEKPEMLRVPLDSICLRVSLMGLGHPAKVLAKAITPPTDAAVVSSLQQLVELSAVELKEKPAPVGAGGEAAGRIGEDGWDRDDQQRLLKAKLRLTPLGSHLAQLPVDAGCGKLLVLGCIFGVPRDVCSLAAALSTKSPFAATASAGKGAGKGESDKKKLELAADLESDQLLLVKLLDKWEQLGKHSQAARAWCRQNGLDMQTLESVGDMRRHLLNVLVEQGFATYEQADMNGWSRGDRQSAISLMPACLSTIASATEEFNRRRFQLLRTLLCAALWPNVMLRKDDGTLFARNQASLTFHPSSVLAVQADQASQDVAGDWHCPQCQFFNFATREECRSCWAPKPPPGQQPKAKMLRHRAFMYGEKTRSLATRPGQKSQTQCRDCCGVPVKALYLLGHRVQVDYLRGFMSLDSWIHCKAAPRDAAMLLGLRRRLQDVLSRRLTRKSGDPLMSAEDAEVVNVMTQILVLDVE